MNGEETLIALGANRPSATGGPRATLETALEMIARRGIVVEARARWRRSPAFPAGSGPDFVNGAARLRASLTPEAVLEALHEVEAALGRERLVRWGPRVCDLDLIACGGQVAPDEATARAWMARGPAAGPAPEGLILPHPRMHERAFVLAPLAEIAPGWRHPLTGLSVAEMLAALPAAEREEVTLA